MPTKFKSRIKADLEYLTVPCCKKARKTLLIRHITV